MPSVVIHSDNPQHLLITNMAKLVKGLCLVMKNVRLKKLHLPTLKYRRISQFGISADAGCRVLWDRSKFTVDNCGRTAVHK